MNIISVVLGADTKKFRTRDSIQILEYAFNNYHYTNLKEKVYKEFEDWRILNNIEIIKGKAKYADVTLENFEYENYPIKKDEEQSIKIIIKCDKVRNAPVYQYEQLGILEIYMAEECITKIKIVSTRNIYKKTEIDFYRDMLRTMWKIRKL